MAKYFVKPITTSFCQDPVIDIISTLPTVPNKGDRYIYNNYIYFYDGNNWVSYLPPEYTKVRVNNIGRIYQLINGAFIEWPQIITVENNTQKSTNSTIPQKVYTFNINSNIHSFFKMYFRFESYNRATSWYAQREGLIEIQLNNITLLTIKTYDTVYSSYTEIAYLTLQSTTQNVIDIYISSIASNNTAYIKDVKIILEQMS